MGLTRKERAEYIKKWHDIKYPDPSETASKMITSAERLDYSTFTDVTEALRKEGETDQ